MKFLTCEIDHVKNPMYERLLNAWEASILQNCPNDTYERAYLNPKDYPAAFHIKNSYLANSVKLNYWGEKLKTEEGNICLIDGDTVVLQDLNHVFDLDFDIAYTRRSPGVRIPINGGVLFIKPSEKVNRFMDNWVWANNTMLTNTAFHRKWYSIYNGINQASFGYTLQQPHGLKIIELPCAVYNACDKVDWVNINASTKVLHVKSDLRVCCLNNLPLREYQKAVQTWKQYETIAALSNS